MTLTRKETKHLRKLGIIPDPRKSKGELMSYLTDTSLNALMVEANMTQTELANMTGFAESSIHNYCTGRTKASFNRSIILYSILNAKIQILKEQFAK